MTVFAGQLAPVRGRLVPACTVAGASTTAAAVTSVVSIAVSVPSVAVTVYAVPGTAEAGTGYARVNSPSPFVVTVSGPPTSAPPPGAVSCTEISVFAGQLAPETARSVPA